MAEETPVTDQQTDKDAKPSGTDTAASSTSGVDETTHTSQDPDEAAGATDDTADDDLQTKFLSEAELDAINAIEDLGKRQKALDRAWTQKTQRLSRERRDLSSRKAVLDSLDRDPLAFARQVLEQAGLEVHDPKADTTTTTDLSAKVTEILKESLGPDYEDLLDKLAPGMFKAINAVVAENLKPLRDGQVELVRDSAIRETEVVFDAFTKKHPDWQQHESAMAELSRKLPPGKDPKTGKPLMEQPEYLELLYGMVTRDRQVGEGVKKVLARTTKAAETAVNDGKGIGADKVVARPAGPISFDEAGALAIKGIRVSE
jgi:hypothetical protein